MSRRTILWGAAVLLVLAAGVTLARAVPALPESRAQVPTAKVVQGPLPMHRATFSSSASCLSMYGTSIILHQYMGRYFYNIPLSKRSPKKSEKRCEIFNAPVSWSDTGI